MKEELDKILKDRQVNEDGVYVLSQKEFDHIDYLRLQEKKNIKPYIEKTENEEIRKKLYSLIKRYEYIKLLAINDIILSVKN